MGDLLGSPRVAFPFLAFLEIFSPWACRCHGRRPFGPPFGFFLKTFRPGRAFVAVSLVFAVGSVPASVPRRFTRRGTRGRTMYQVMGGPDTEARA